MKLTWCNPELPHESVYGYDVTEMAALYRAFRARFDALDDDTRTKLSDYHGQYTSYRERDRYFRLSIELPEPYSMNRVEYVTAVDILFRDDLNMPIIDWVYWDPEGGRYGVISDEISEAAQPYNTELLDIMYARYPDLLDDVMDCFDIAIDKIRASRKTKQRFFPV